MEFELLKLLNEFGRKATKEDFTTTSEEGGEEGGEGGGGGGGVEEEVNIEDLTIVEYK